MTSCCQQHPMPWNGVTGAIARCKRVSTACGRKSRSVHVLHWICGVKRKPKAVNKPLHYFIVHGLDKPGSSATVSEFLCIVETGDEAGVSGEGVEYGTMTVAAVMLQQISGQDRELEIDLHMLGTILSQELTAVMEELHCCKPGDGYRPVAWHNVFWN